MVGKEQFQEINQYLNQLIDEKKVLIAVHRGSSQGNIIENTIPAYVAALKMGGDILEADVIQSKDHELYHFHSGMEIKDFMKDIDIQEYSSSEIKELVYVNSNLEKTSYPVEKVEDMLTYFKDRCLINLDRAWEFFPELCALVEKTETVKQVILKGPLTKNVLVFLATHSTKFMFMPKVSSLSELNDVLKVEDVNIVGVEIKVEDETSDFFQNKNLEIIKKNQLFIWVNALSMSDEKRLFAGYDDNLSIIEGESMGWGTILDKGATIIQTDWPSLLYKYRHKWLREKGMK